MKWTGTRPLILTPSINSNLIAAQITSTLILRQSACLFIVLYKLFLRLMYFECFYSPHHFLLRL